MKLLYFFALIAVIIWVLRVCSPGNYSNIQPEEVQQVTLEELNTFIDELNGTPVLVTGTVMETFYLGITDCGFYIIEDDSGQWLTVTTLDGVTPATGEVVAVIVIPKVLARTNAGTTVTAAEYRRIITDENTADEYDSNNDQLDTADLEEETFQL